MKHSDSAASLFPTPGHDHEECAANLMARAERICARRGSRLTGLRRSVLEAAGRSHQAAGAYELIERMAEKGPRPAPISVYRALDFLAAHGLVHKIESKNAFIACSLSHRDPRAILLLCEDCGRVAELEAAPVFSDLERRAATTGFRPRSAMIELSGYCGHCGSA